MLFLACLLWNSALRSHHSLELGLANILIQKFKGQDFLRMLNFLPDIMQAARVGFFRTIFSPWETFLTHQLLFLSQKQFAECIATTGLRG
jgi:ABC-type sugar transport system permease subunit